MRGYDTWRLQNDRDALDPDGLEDVRGGPDPEEIELGSCRVVAGQVRASLIGAAAGVSGALYRACDAHGLEDVVERLEEVSALIRGQLDRVDRLIADVDETLAQRPSTRWWEDER